MIAVTFSIKYQVEPGQYLSICGACDALGAGQESQALPMQTSDQEHWTLTVQLPQGDEDISYTYLLCSTEGQVIRREWKPLHRLILNLPQGDIKLIDHWITAPEGQAFYTSAYYDVLSYRPTTHQHTELGASHYLVLQVHAPAIPLNKQAYVLGSSAKLGAWELSKALPMEYIGRGAWRLCLPLDPTERGQSWEYKYLIADTERQSVLWEQGDNHSIYLGDEIQGHIYSTGLSIADKSYRPRYAGAVSPVFSLRHADDAGIGDFRALREAVDWAECAGLHILQILPINDTTFYRDWRDSYPYNAISTDALHPIYISIGDLPDLSDSLSEAEYRQRASELRQSDTVPYPEVIALKESYLRQHYAEYGAKTLRTQRYKAFYTDNADWLTPYAAYCVLRDKHPGESFGAWGQYSRYDAEAIADLARSKEYKADFAYYYYVQYLLHEQLSELAEYARERAVLLKGDLPIGVAPHSVEVWLHPELFHTDRSAGAPPDDFALRGQNWGFPTYNWERMFDDDLAWWRSRLARLSQYFRGFRIDHILGFFRIWEIPADQSSGLLGHFNPAMPLGLDYWQTELAAWGDVSLLTKPLITHEEGERTFGTLLPQLIEQGIWNSIDGGKYLILSNSKQRYWQNYSPDNIAGGETTLNLLIDYCEEVALIADTTNPQLYHPRIAFERSRLFSTWSKAIQDKWLGISHWYYHEHHNTLWKQTALKRLRPLLSSTDILLCAEDLGMIPRTVPEVLDELQILSLDLERMPKAISPHGFAHLDEIPYLSVCTTSTHDMPPLRAWWQGLGRERQALYIGEVLRHNTLSPDSPIDKLMNSIVAKHLASPAMLAILPIQDLMSIDARLHLQTAEAEQINHPENPNQHWCYRLPLPMSELHSQYPDWTERIAQMLNTLDRE